ncbi:competence type IV pilus assembly protein ComGB [Filibacter tadaridae]|uniref:Type II secretion system protein F n=1 Tax=Filibacter tadaridae TaxID=2483811 RepID=A0A3P5XCJ8_9BACL|nr:competence type IV pilus assembly protein ComGB [Filibacter tadaridae]VDC32425.1 Type II secretion system protein F [Filibacter tadaridae]
MDKTIKNFSFRKGIVLDNRPAFLERLSVLLMEGYTFNDGLNLLLPYHCKEYTDVLTLIDNDFKEGQDVTHILKRLGFTTSALLPVAIAEMDGRLAHALRGMAERLKSAEEKKKKFKNLLAYPAVLFVFIAALLFAFRKFFLPNMEALALSRQGQSNGFVSSLPQIVSKIPDVIVGVILIMLLITTGCYVAFRKMEPAKKIRFLLSLPIIGVFFSEYKTRVFSGELGSLLHSGLSMQDALDILNNQELDPILGEMAKNVRELVVYGEPFHMAVQMTDGLLAQMSAFAKHGADSGYLPKELTLYSEQLDETIDRQLSKGLALLQPILFSLIAICILAAYLALLLPVYGMMDNF